jgi:hypothetical protein
VGSEEGLLLRVPHRFRTDVRMRYSPSSPNSESEGVGPVNEKVPAQTDSTPVVVSEAKLHYECGLGRPSCEWGAFV